MEEFLQNREKLINDWIDAAININDQFGTAKASGYLVGEKFYNLLTELFQRISLACDLSLPEIDRLLFRYGSGHKMRYAICGTDPLCDICKVPKCSHANR